MRLVDADALIADIDDYIEEYSEVDCNGLHSGKWCAMCEAKYLLDNAPTIDAVPIELTAQHLGRSFHSEPEKWADWLHMIRDDIPEEQDAQEADC